MLADFSISCKILAAAVAAVAALRTIDDANDGCDCRHANYW